MNAIPAHARATVEDYLSLAPGGPRFELIEGELRMAPAPSLKHQRILGELSYLIRHHLKSHPVGEVFFSPCDVFLTEFNVFQPDLLFVSSERAKILSERGIEGAPDLVVEILSPGSREQDRGGKKRVYAATGVTEYWIVDPDLEEVMIFRLREDASRPLRTLRKGDSLATRVIPALEINLGEVFREAEDA